MIVYYSNKYNWIKYALLNGFFRKAKLKYKRNSVNWNI